MEDGHPEQPSPYRAAIWAAAGALALCLAAVFSTPARAGGTAAEHVVNIYAEVGQSRAGATMAQGTGFFIAADGTIVTAYHVVRGARRVTIWDARSNKFEGAEVLLVAADPERDLALLRVSSRLVHPHLRLGFGRPEQGDTLSVVGNFRGMQAHRMQTHATEPAGQARVDWRPGGDGRGRVEIIPLDLPVLKGMSGAPVLSADGRAIGVLSGEAGDNGGVAWAIPARYIEALIARGDAPRKFDAIARWPGGGGQGGGWADLRRRYVTNAEAADAIVRFHERLEVLDDATETLSRNAGAAARVVTDMCGAVRARIDDLTRNYGWVDAARLNGHLARGPAPLRMTRAVIDARAALAERLDAEDELRALIDVFEGWMSSTDLEGEDRLAVLEFRDEVAVRYQGISERGYEASLGLDTPALAAFLDRLPDGLPRFESAAEAERYVATCRAVAADLDRYGWLHEADRRLAEHDLFAAYAGIMERFEQYFVGMPVN